MSRLDSTTLPQELFAPLHGSSPCGEPVRYDRAYRLIQEAREADDPDLPMGDWDRPLKRADWKQVANRCQEVLSTRCKDLQVCAWLTEAWIHLHGISGLIGGLQLMLRLCSDFWPTLHPLIEDDDDAARVAPFTWMNENLAHTISLHTVLLTMPSGEQITVATWDEALRNDNDSRRKSEKERTEFRLEIISAATAVPSAHFVQMARDATDALSMLDALDTLLNDKLGSDGPSVARLRNMLHTLRNILQELRPDIQTALAASARKSEPDDDHAGTQTPTNTQSDMTMDSDVQDTSSTATTGPIRSREDAYQRLAEVAEFLQRTEPHSPTPYLIQRAVQWGKMSLADLVQESLRDEGDLLRLYSMLGMRSGRNGE